MPRTFLFLVALSAITMSAEAIQAQAQIPTHVVMRYFKCTDQGEAIRALQQARPIMNEMIAEGKFLDYGILSHNWGDEWNVVDYTLVAGLDDFFANFSELISRVTAAAPQDDSENDEDAPSLASCTEHKDNIYSWVAPAM